ncbi:MAG: hypothetical protein OEZ08_17365, partial [Betaproteobacteria bacterium]|nr:hypothetical protein [Betaproteobacteria bacterium]
RWQRGQALLIMLTVLILGTAWFTVGALSKAAHTQASREIRTGEALRVAKNALLAYVAQYAARNTTNEPGQLPCPESVTLANVGEANTGCSASLLVVGRLPWKTLGIDQLRDGDGEPLWYVMRGFRDPPVNFGTPGQLSVNGSAVVAVVIAPGRPLNTAAQAGTPPAECTKLDQLAATRNAAPLNPANYLECGTAGGIFSSPGDSLWTNDRVIAITAAEWGDAIAGPIAERLQRQVAPAMEDFRSTTSLASWQLSFFPNASKFNSSTTNPPSNDLCGAKDTREGMPPTADAGWGSCNTNWSTASASGYGPQLSSSGCTIGATELRCSFTKIAGGATSTSLSIVAPKIGYSFRSFNPSDVRIEVNSGAPQTVIVQNYVASVSAADGKANVSFQVVFPPFAIGDSAVVTVPHPRAAFQADGRMQWFLANGWDRHTFYSVARAATSDSGVDVCTPPGPLTNCLSVTGLPSPSDDKRLVLVLMGSRAVASQSWPGGNVGEYLEGQNSSPGNHQFEARPADAAFNDRIAACPYQATSSSGSVTLCN